MDYTEETDRLIERLTNISLSLRALNDWYETTGLTSEQLRRKRRLEEEEKRISDRVFGRLSAGG